MGTLLSLTNTRGLTDINRKVRLRSTSPSNILSELLFFKALIRFPSIA